MCQLFPDLSLKHQFRNGGHVWPVVFEEYPTMKERFGLRAAEKIAKFRMMHLDAFKQTLEEAEKCSSGLKETCQFRDVEAIEASMHPGTWKERKQKFKECRGDLPELCADWKLYEGPEASKACNLSP
jgi:hypothetical protein